MASVLPVLSQDSYIQSDSLYASSTCDFSSFSASSLLLMKVVIIPGKVAGYVYSLFTVPGITSLSVSVESSRPVINLSTSVSSYSGVSTRHHSVALSGVAGNTFSFCCFSELVGWTPANKTTTPFGVDLSMPQITLSCLLTSYW